MRIATWNVNSLKARLPRVEEWLALRQPDILLMQETKLADEAAPTLAFERAGYVLAHHGEGRWNGVAIASRVGVADVVTNFGDGPVGVPAPVADGLWSQLEVDGLKPAEAGSGGSEGADVEESGAGEGLGVSTEARMIAATCGGVRIVSVYAPNGRALDTPFYEAKLAWYDRLARWLDTDCTPADQIVLGGDFNVAPADADVYDPAAFVGSTHVSDAERAAVGRLRAWGLVDAYRRFHPESGRFSWWDYRAGNFHKGLGMRIDHLYVTEPVAARSVGAEIDRDARKGKLPSDHAPVWLDLAD